MYKIRIYAIFRDSKSKQYRVTYCFCMERLCDKSLSHSTTHNSNIFTEEMYEIDISIYIEKDWITYQYNSFVRGYHDYMNKWNPLTGETLKCWQEPSKRWTKMLSRHKVWLVGERNHCWVRSTKHFQNLLMFLKVLNTSIEV